MARSLKAAVTERSSADVYSSTYPLVPMTRSVLTGWYTEALNVSLAPNEREFLLCLSEPAANKTEAYFSSESANGAHRIDPPHSSPESTKASWPGHIPSSSARTGAAQDTLDGRSLKETCFIF